MRYRGSLVTFETGPLFISNRPRRQRWAHRCV